MHSFCKHLYTQNDEISINNYPSLLRLYKNMPCLTGEDKLLMDSDISISELELIIKSSKSNKSPDPDGFSNEFLNFIWPHISYILLQLMYSYRNKGEIEASQIMGLIKCISKGGKLRKEPINWCPITLLNSIYKSTQKFWQRGSNDFYLN